MTNKELQEKLSKFPDEYEIKFYTKGVGELSINEVLVYNLSRDLVLKGE